MPEHQQKISRVPETKRADRALPCASAVPKESANLVQRAEQEQREGEEEGEGVVVPVGAIAAVNSAALLGPTAKIMQEQPDAASSEAERQRGAIHLQNRGPQALIVYFLLIRPRSLLTITRL